MATAPPQADAVLVRRLRERDRTAWEELYDEYGRRLHAFAYRLAGNPHDADDLVQETFVRALPRLDRLDPETVDLGPYLFTTLRNLFLKTVERRRRAELHADVPEPAEPAPIEDDPERSTLLHGQQEEMRSANARLAPRQRLVLALRELEDKSYAEIGEIVGLKENAVAQLISRARDSLRTELRLAQVDPGRLPEECRRNLPLLSRHLDGQLRGPQLEATLAHLDGCVRCQDALDSMREAQRRYRLLPPLLFAGDELRARIDLKLTAARYWEGVRWQLGRRGAVVVAVAALFAVGGGGVGAALVIGGKVTGGSDPVVEVAAKTFSRTTATRAATSATTEAPATTERATVAAKPPPPVATSTALASTVVTSVAATSTAAATTTAATTAPAPTTEPPAKTRSVAPSPPVAPPPAPTTTAAVTTTPSRDTTAPVVTIVGRPAAQTTAPAATFSFRASEGDVTFSCRLDDGPYESCVSPVTREGLGLGAHTFAVRARDKAGNTGPAATAAWTILPPPDTTPPVTTIVAATTSGGDANFQFTASEPGSTFTCALDGGAPASCTSPHAYSGLAPGAHSFAVRATDPAGNTGGAAAHSWTIAPPPPPPPALPDLVVSALSKSGFAVTNTGAAPAGPFVVSVTLIGTFTIPGLAPGQTVTRTWSICRVGTITAIADRGADVAESNERNNARSIASTC